MNNKKTFLTIALCAALAAGIGGVAYFAGTKTSQTSSTDSGSTDISSSNTASGNKSSNTKTNSDSSSDSGKSTGTDSGNTSSGTTATDLALKITEKDNEITYDTSKSKVIKFTDSTGTEKITQEGTYIVTGSTSNGMIIIDVGEEEDVHLVLRDANINSATSAAIYVISADEVYITLEGENTLSNGGSYEAIDENDIDAVIYSKDDLTINGEGSLKINTQAEHAIVCKDDMVITGGTYDLTAKTDAINTNDSIAITNGTFTINCGDDALHTDGILQIDGGTFDITAAEGLEGTYITVNNGTININASDDGINAAQKVSDYKATLVVNGGTITIKMGQGDTDGIDSNGDIYINGGTIDITGQSTIDYDGTAVKNGGTLIINGTETDTIPNQFMGGGMGGGRGDRGNSGEGEGDGNFPGGTLPSDFPSDGNFPSDFPSDGNFPGGNFPSDGNIPSNFPSDFPGGDFKNGKTEDSSNENNNRQKRGNHSTNAEQV